MAALVAGFRRPDEKDWLDSVIREVKAVRERGRPLRCVDARQDRRAGARCGGIPQPALLQRLVARSRSARRATGSCCAKTASSSTTARRRRLADDHFFMTTTTANAARVMSHMEFCHQALWPELDVQYVSVTEQWAQMAVAGPKARATLQKIIDDVDAQRRDLPLSRRRRRSACSAASRRGCSASRFRASMPMNCRCRPTTATWSPAR